MVAGKAKFRFDKFQDKLKEFGIPKKQAEELSHHLLELDIFLNGFQPHINKIMKCKKSEKDKFKDLLEELSGEFEFHIVDNHIVPAKEILNKITNKLE